MKVVLISLPLLLLSSLFQLPSMESAICAKTVKELPRVCSAGEDHAPRETSQTTISRGRYQYVCHWVCASNEPKRWELDAITINRKKSGREKSKQQ